MEIRASMRQQADGRWTARVDGHPALKSTGATKARCLAGLRRALERAEVNLGPKGEELALIVEVLPLLAGVAEAADVMRWDKRRVITYVDRKRFPEPVQTLASGRLWLRSDLETYAAEWRARQSRRGRAPTANPRPAARGRRMKGTR